MKLLQVTGLRKSFRTRVGELEVLCGIDIEVEEAEMVAIVGASGVGKSTLLHILGTLDRPTRGKVCYRGEDVFALAEGPLSRFRNREIGFVFQFHHLLPEFTALENVMMPGLISELELDEVKSRASGLLDELGLSERMHHRPGELSGGEQQRVAIARALVMEPLVVLADEPTGNLDTKTGGRLFNLIEDINRKKGTTFMIVTHNDSLATRCSRIVRMVDGRIVSG
ncbi:MAG TPA: ABC transporter ATP-binding protein [Nitrospirae bacterium]|nr:lipoprotein-releasing system ATP-binding protein LolD [bacterium BMS3Abin08]HDY70496.1 ABC transporter ATP-binding protein [Nitrospirota bacterium]